MELVYLIRFQVPNHEGIMWVEEVSMAALWVASPPILISTLTALIFISQITYTPDTHSCPKSNEVEGTFTKLDSSEASVEKKKKKTLIFGRKRIKIVGEYVDGCDQCPYIKNQTNLALKIFLHLTWWIIFNFWTNSYGPIERTCWVMLKRF